MDPLRRAIRRAFNAIDPAGLYGLTGDPGEYQVEVDCLIATFAPLHRKARRPWQGWFTKCCAIRCTTGSR